MTERWTQWKPISNLTSKYCREFIVDSVDEFQVILSEYYNVERKIRVKFKHLVESYRSINESYIIKLIEDLDKKYGTKFYSEWAFFEVKNSDYLKGLSEKSYTISDTRNFRHFVILTFDEILDIISLNEPEIEFINEIELAQLNNYIKNS